jgi:hypothetical protein
VFTISRLERFCSSQTRDIIIHGDVVTDKPHEPLTVLNELDPGAANFHQDHSCSVSMTTSKASTCEAPTAHDDPQLLQFDDLNITPQDREYDHPAIFDALLTGHDIPKTDFSNEFPNTADQET